MNYIRDINLKDGDRYNMVVEIRKGSKEKSELLAPDFDRLVCVRKLKVRYPYYYGCFPQTAAGDKDPADAILLTKNKHNLLDIVQVKPIAVIKTLDDGYEDNKIICVEEDLKHADKLIKLVMKFLSIYKGKKANMVIDPVVYGPEEAIKMLENGSSQFTPKTATALTVD